MSDNVWQGTGGAASGAQGPGVMDFFNATLQDFQKNFAGNLLAGLGLGLVMFPLVFLDIAILYGGMFLGMMPGIAMEDEGMMIGGMFASMGAGMLLVLALSVGLIAPIYASLYRAMWGYLVRGEALGVTSSFSFALQDLGAVYGVWLIVAGLSMLGLPLFCVGQLVVAFFLTYAIPLVCIHRLSPLAAVRLSFRTVQQDPGLHLAVFAVQFVVAMVLSYIPLLGYMLAYPFVVQMQLRCYRHVFGEGEVPREVEAAA